MNSGILETKKKRIIKEMFHSKPFQNDNIVGEELGINLLEKSPQQQSKVQQCVMFGYSGESA